MNSMILDTSSILFALSNKVDIFQAIKEQSSAQIIISQGVVNELEGIAGSSKSDAKYAAVALELIKRYSIKVEKDSSYVDKWILNYAKKPSSVCTNDMKLKKALTARGIAVYSISRDGILR